MYVGWEEAKEAVQNGKKVNFYHNDQKVVLNHNSNMNELYKIYGYFNLTIHDVVNGKYIII